MFVEFVQEQILLFIALGVIVIMLISNYFSDKVSGFATVNADEAVRLYNQGAFVLDVRTDSEYKSGYIGEAVNISSSEIAKKVDTIGADKDQDILIYCQSGARSAGAARTLAKHGYTKLHNLGGGIMSWKSASLPLNKPVSKKKQKREQKGK